MGLFGNNLINNNEDTSILEVELELPISEDIECIDEFTRNITVKYDKKKTVPIHVDTSDSRSRGDSKVGAGKESRVGHNVRVKIKDKSGLGDIEVVVPQSNTKDAYIADNKQTTEKNNKYNELLKAITNNRDLLFDIDSERDKEEYIKKTDKLKEEIDGSFK